MRILLTGGSGLLGTHLSPLLKAQVDTPSSKELDITKILWRGEYDLIIHAAAYTQVSKAEIEREKCFAVNVMGTKKLVEAYKHVPFVYISSEYAQNPVNHYSVTKWLGELVVNEIADKCLIVRTLFKPTPFPYVKGFTDQYTQGDYVDVIAPLLAHEIFKWVGGKSKMIYVGTGRKSMYDLALRTRKDVVPGSINDIVDVKLPTDYEN